MNRLDRLLIEREAASDAREGVEVTEQRLLADLGPRPETRPETSYRDRAIHAALNNRNVLRDLQDSLRQAEAAYGRHLPVLGLRAAIGIAAFAEFATVNSILASFGYAAGVGRACAAVLLSFGMVFITAFIMRALFTPDAAAGAPAKRPLATKVVLLAYVVLVVAIATARAHGGSEDTPRLIVWAETVILLAITALPGYGIHWLYARLTPAKHALFTVKTLRRQIRTTEREHARAAKHMTKLAERQDRYDAEIARRRAAHQVAYAHAANESEVQS